MHAGVQWCCADKRPLLRHVEQLRPDAERLGGVAKLAIVGTHAPGIRTLTDVAVRWTIRERGRFGLAKVAHRDSGSPPSAMFDGQRNQLHAGYPHTKAQHVSGAAVDDGVTPTGAAFVQSARDAGWRRDGIVDVAFGALLDHLDVTALS